MLKIVLLLLFPVFLQENPVKKVQESPEGQKQAVPAEALKLHLKQAILMAMENNLDIEVARFQPLINEANTGTYEAPFDYSLYGQGSKTLGTALQFIDFLGTQTAQVDSDSNSLTVGARKMIPFGVHFDLSYQLTDSTSLFPGIPEVDRWNQSLALSVVVPVLKGAGTEYNYSSLLIARNTRNSSIYVFERTLTESLYQVHEVYWNLVYAIENRRVKQQSLEVAIKLRDETARKLEHGVVIRLDLTQAEAGVATRQEDILTAQAAVLNSIDQLKRKIDPSLLRGDRLIQPSDTPKDVVKMIDEKKAVQEAFTLALKHRPDYLQLELDMDSQQITMNRADRDLLPKLNLTGKASLEGFGRDFSDSREDLFDTETHNFGVILDFEYVFGQSAARGTYNSAELTKRQLQLKKRNLEDQILVEVREAVRTILTNEKRIVATKKARTLAEEQFQAELNRKKRQVSTTFRVLDVQEDLAKAQANEMKSLIDYQLSLVNLERVTGTLLKKMGVKFQETLIPRTKWNGR